MPLPTPKAGEKEQDFLNRCMGNEVLQSEFKDQDQRLAVCYSQWKKSKKRDDEMKVERRIWPENEIRVALLEGSEEKNLEGYAAVFEQLSGNLGGFREKVARGTFERSVKEADVRALMNHDPNFVLGRTTAKTLVLEEDERGLKTKIIPPKTQWAKDLIESISRGDITQMSFGFRVVKDAWERMESENVRTLIDVDLVDVSPVTFPAYPQTSIQSRGAIEEMLGMDFEDIQKVWVRSLHNLPMDEGDLSVVESALEKLNTIKLDLGESFRSEEQSEQEEQGLLVGVQMIRLKRRMLDLRNRISI